MKHGYGMAAALVSITVCSLLSFTAAAADYDPQKEIVIPYTEFNGQAVELVVDGNFKSVTLRVRIENFPPPNRSPELEFLKQEVIRFKKEKKVTLGNSGYELVYKGGYPSWEPMAISNPPAECLTFAEGTLSDQTITAKGKRKRPAHYPYED